MRSRYAAYSMGLVDYIKITTHHDSPHREHDDPVWTAGIALFSQQTAFTSLRIHESKIEEVVAHVRFSAGLERGGADVSFEENSRFELVDGRWLYLRGE